MENHTLKQIAKPNFLLIAIILLLLNMMVSLVVHSQPTDSSKVWFTPNLACVDMLDLFNNPEQ